MEEKVISRLMETGDGRLHRNLSPAKLVELALERGEGTLASNGALVTRTGERSGRSPKDRFIVEDKWAKKRVAWGGVNRPVSPEVFDRLLEKAGEYLSSRDRFVFEGYVGADPQYRMTLRVIAEKAWHALFAETLFIRPPLAERARLKPEFTVIDAMDLKIDPAEYGIRSGTFVGISFERRIVLIIASGYGGEIKKSIFSVMNGTLPDKKIFPMHCSANVGSDGQVALFFAGSVHCWRMSSSIPIPGPSTTTPVP